MCDSKKLILYLHIPKTGGTTLNDLIYQNYSSDKHYGDDKSGFFHAGVYFYPVGFFFNENISLSSDIINNLIRKDLRAVVGHFQFGIHKYVSKPYIYVTILRNPINRIVSFYRHLKAGWQQDIDANKIDARIYEFLLGRKFSELFNDQTRRISGNFNQNRSCTKYDLEVAIENLHHEFSFVGTTERFDETLILMKRQLGWVDNIKYYPKNKNTSKSNLTISKKVLDLVTEYNEYDFKLYDIANKLLDEAISKQDPTFYTELEEYTKSNWATTYSA